MKLPKNCKIEAVASDDLTRQSITEPYLDAAGGRMIATNGRALVVIPVETGEHDANGFVSAQALAAARKTVRKGEDISMACNGSLAIANGPTFPRPDLGEFPKVEQIIAGVKSKDLPVIRVGLNATLLAQIVAAMGTEGVVLEIQAEKDGCVMQPLFVKPLETRETKPSAVGAFGILMPINVR